MYRKNMKWVAFMAVAVIVVGCGPNDEINPVGNIRQATGTSPLTWYVGTDAVAYAGTNWNKSDGPAPFDTFSQNCVNFVSQCILAGLTGDKTIIPTDLYDQEKNFDSDAKSTKAIKWYYHFTSADGTGSGAAWRSTTNLLKYARQSASEAYGLRFAYVTNSDRASPENFYVETVQPGDVVFVQWYVDGGTYHHTMIVVKVDPDTTKGSLDRITVAAQNTNTPGSTLRQEYDWDKGPHGYGDTAIFQIYRPWYYYTSP